jgi:hypothetical protein
MVINKEIDHYFGEDHRAQGWNRYRLQNVGIVGVLDERDM